jgi:hypothetical protein
MTTELAPTPPPAHLGSWLPTWPLIRTRHLELRRRRGLMITLVLLTVGPVILILGLRLLFHAIDPHTYSPAGNPGVFQTVTDLISLFGFIAAASVGATTGSTDLTDGMFRHLVVTGRSRIALYLARIPAALSMILVLVTIGYAANCFVVQFAGQPQPTAVQEGSASIPFGLSQTQLHGYLLSHPADMRQVFAFNGGGVAINGPGPKGSGGPSLAELTRFVNHQMPSIYAGYTAQSVSELNPADNEMIKIGLWLVLDVSIGLFVGLGLGSLMGSRTVPTVLLVVLQLIITPLLSSNVIPYFINGQRLIIGVAMNQLRPAGLPSQMNGRNAGAIPPMPTWAMVAVIVGWIVVASALGTWKMARRDA